MTNQNEDQYSDIIQALVGKAEAYDYAIENADDDIVLASFCLKRSALQKQMKMTQAAIAHCHDPKFISLLLWGAK